MILEGYLHEKKCFVTLTYDDEHFPKDASLDPRHPKLFIGRMRKELPVGSLRVLTVGEYGHDGEREINPHYHLAMYGFACAGPIKFYESGKRCWCENCEFIRKKWGKGNIVVEELNRKSAQYIAGYVVKKLTHRFDERLFINGDPANRRYPEFCRPPRRPGLAHGVIDGFVKSMTGSDGQFFLSDRGDVPNVFMVEGKALPMGRYLMNKLRDRVGIKEVSRDAYVKEMQALWYDAQLDASIPEEEKLSIRKCILSHYAGQRAQVHAAFNLYKQKGVL